MPNQCSLLIVDNDRRSRDCLTRQFLSRGNLVVPVSHPRQALEAASIYDFDVALLDQSLPELPGAILIPRLRGLVGDLKVVLLSSDPDRVSREEAVECGADAFLHKPCSFDDVEAKVSELFMTTNLHPVHVRLPRNGKLMTRRIPAKA